MGEVVQKVTAFMVRERNGVEELLVFKHPTAGIQIPAGTVEAGEDIETAVKREAYEETGLQLVEIENYLGYIENELENNQRIIAETTQVYIEPSLNASLKTRLSFLMRKNSPRDSPSIIILHRVAGDFTHISYIEYDRHPLESHMYQASGKSIITLPDGCRMKT